MGTATRKMLPLVATMVELLLPLLLTASDGWLAVCRLHDSAVLHVSRVHTMYYTTRCEFGGKNLLFASRFSKNTKFTVRNARCFTNLFIKMDLKTFRAFCTNFGYEWPNFYQRKLLFSRRDKIFK